MKVLGVIVEFNPYHNGHRFYLDQAKALIKPDVIIAICSTNFTMRGDIAVCDKFTKTQMMLSEGIDLVIELPTVDAVQSADYFAMASVTILNKMGITDLAFGSEITDLKDLEKLEQLMRKDEFNHRLKKHLKRGNSYKVAHAETLKEYFPKDDLSKHSSKPNATLAIQYCRYARLINHSIRLHPLKRSDASDDITSASNIRSLLLNGENPQKYLPKPNKKYRFIDQKKAYDTFYQLLKYKLLVINENLDDHHGVTEGIENYLIKGLMATENFEELNDYLKTKRYSLSRLHRLMIYILLDIKKINYPKDYYLRILGFSKTGEQYLRTLPSNIKNQIITTFKNITSTDALIELKATKLYGILSGNHQLYLQEYQIPLKRKE
ncbi:MAG: nucleotidyltransferase family protein [Bacilli bacterium]|jgi:predicted nucleotidyltransferase|nr:nucleotidyltransferase family protein [Acholeplasmataceae bacterium]